MDNITYSLTRVSDAITDKVVYRANVQTNGTIGRDELAERLAARTKQDVSLWKYYIDALSEELKTHLLAGYRINLGQLLTGFAIRGAFKSEDEAFDPDRHQLIATVRTLDPLKSAIAAVAPENIVRGLTCVVAAAMDAVSGTRHICRAFRDARVTRGNRRGATTRRSTASLRSRRRRARTRSWLAAATGNASR